MASGQGHGPGRGLWFREQGKGVMGWAYMVYLAYFGLLVLLAYWLSLA